MAARKILSNKSQYMTSDICYKLTENRRVSHLYSSKVNIISDPFAQTLLAKLSGPNTKLPEINFLIEKLYHVLFWEMAKDLFPLEKVSWDTRMKGLHPEAVFKGDIINQKTPAIVVDLARAGTFPSHTCFELLNYLKNSDFNRQDHFYINRKVNKQSRVVGVDVSGSKIGGGQEGAMVFFPDPMGATGGTLAHCISHYKNKVEGSARCYVGLHLIITPEFIKKITAAHPDVYIYALRLDRGFSTDAILKSIPGKFKNKEIGLNKNQYIVPGAGGIGEILNNAFV